jgi:hypothetical protein
MEIVGVVAMAGITFPLSFLLARLCLRGVVRVVTGGDQRAVR